MARKLLPSEELAFSQHRPFAELVFDSEEYCARYFRRKIIRGWTDSKPSASLSEDALHETDGPKDDWF
jgi:hypothetical protein